MVGWFLLPPRKLLGKITRTDSEKSVRYFCCAKNASQRLNLLNNAVNDNRIKLLSAAVYVSLQIYLWRGRYKITIFSRPQKLIVTSALLRTAHAGVRCRIQKITIASSFLCHHIVCLDLFPATEINRDFNAPAQLMPKCALKFKKWWSRQAFFGVVILAAPIFSRLRELIATSVLQSIPSRSAL